MLFDKRFSLKTVYYRSFLLMIVIPILPAWALRILAMADRSMI